MSIYLDAANKRCGYHNPINEKKIKNMLLTRILQRKDAREAYVAEKNNEYHIHKKYA